MTKIILTLVAVCLLAFPVAAQTFDTSVSQGGGSFGQTDEGDDDSDDDEGRSSYDEQRGLYVHAGVARWTAQFGENYGMGVGGEGGYIHGLNEKLLLRLTAGFYAFTADNIAGGPQFASSDMSTFPLLVGVEWLVSPQATLVPYVGGAAGFTFLNATFRDPSRTQFEFAKVLDAYPTVQGRAGFMVRRPQSSIEYSLMATYTFVIDELKEWNMGTSATHDFYQITGGVSYFFEIF